MKRFALSTVFLFALFLLFTFAARLIGSSNKNPAEILREEAYSESVSPFSKQISLGEAISVLGDPVYADVCLARAFDSHNYGYDYSPTTLIVFKSGAWLSAQSRQRAFKWFISPDMTVTSISYNFPINIRAPWRGFRDRPELPHTCGVE